MFHSKKVRKEYLVALAIVVASAVLFVPYYDFSQKMNDPFYCEADSDCVLKHEIFLNHCDACDPCVSADMTDDSVIAFNKNWPKCPKIEGSESIMCAACSSMLKLANPPLFAGPKCINNRCEKVIKSMINTTPEEFFNFIDPDNSTGYSLEEIRKIMIQTGLIQ